MGRFRVLCERALLHHGQYGAGLPAVPKQLNLLLNPARGWGGIHFKSHHRNEGFCLLSNQEALLLSVVCNSS